MSRLPDATVCQIHMREERDRPGDYRSCFECWHVYRSAEELEREYNANDDVPYRTADEITFCPLCLHDW